MMYGIRIKQSGQTIVEAIVLVGIIMILATGLVTAATQSLRVARFSKAKNLATTYAQEALETLRTTRDTKWEDFYALKNTTQCMDKQRVLDLSPPAVCSGNIDNVFTRSVTLTWESIPPNPDRMKVDASVSWVDGGKTNTVSTSTYLTQWQ